MTKIASRNTFGSRVRNLRRELGLSQKGLAEKVKIKQSSLSDIETGKTSIKDVKAPTFMGLVTSLKADPFYLLTGVEPLIAKQDLTANPDELALIHRYRAVPQNHRAAILNFARTKTAELGVLLSIFQNLITGERLSNTLPLKEK